MNALPEEALPEEIVALAISIGAAAMFSAMPLAAQRKVVAQLRRYHSEAFVVDVVDGEARP